MPKISSISFDSYVSSFAPLKSSKIEVKTDNDLYTIRDPENGDILFQISEDKEIIISDKTKINETVEEFVRVLKYVINPKEHQDMDCKVAITYCVAALKAILNEVPKENLSENTKNLINLAERKGAKVFY